MMMRLFGRKKSDPKPNTTGDTPDPNKAGDLREAILKSREAIETLEKRQLLLEKKISTQDELARQKAREGDKRGALFALKRKKMFEKELEQLGNAHLTLEQQIIALESAQTQQVAVGALAAGVVAQKALNQQLNVSKIDNLMEDIQEQVALQNELAQILTQGAPITDDTELLAELQALETRQLEEALVDATPVPTGIVGAPAVATWKPVAAAPSTPGQSNTSAHAVSVEASSSNFSTSATRVQPQLLEPTAQHAGESTLSAASAMFLNRGAANCNGSSPKPAGSNLRPTAAPPIQCPTMSLPRNGVRPATAGTFGGSSPVPNLALAFDRETAPPTMSSARCSSGTPKLLETTANPLVQHELPHSAMNKDSTVVSGSAATLQPSNPPTDEQQFQKLLEELS